MSETSSLTPSPTQGANDDFMPEQDLAAKIEDFGSRMTAIRESIGRVIYSQERRYTRDTNDNSSWWTLSNCGGSRPLENAPR